MVNQLNKCSCNVTELTKPLRELLKTYYACHLGIAQESVFTEKKNELTLSRTLGHCDPNKDNVVSADESSFGLGAVIRQKHGEIFTPVVYDSRSMSYTEQRHAQIEKEALALIWAFKTFSNYLRVRSSISELTTSRSYRYSAVKVLQNSRRVYKDSGCAFMPVDILFESNELENETIPSVNSIVNNFLSSYMRLQDIRDECVKYEICKTLKLYCKEGRQENPSLNDSLKPYWSLQGELTIGAICPRSLQDEILDRLHDDD
ncbi:unnamed protein product [Mytilus coruscus]|uniref:Reverse transcriptase/retrotransposon-derived protein RNase H-like domain-containing protein n=1 Tax=Mytilus coruscus TaxID=42192 RepID=A0A6J8C359_MYTCO|nr:unnamed protein product [Mytilus coruscus]